MTEERKIQLGVAVDASGATPGFEQVKQGARDMAQAVGQAGQAASKGMDAIGDGAKRAADGFNREEGRLRASMLRVTSDLKTLGLSQSEKFSAKIDVQGLDPAKFQPYLAALREVEVAQERAAQQRVATSFTDGLRTQIAALQEQARLQSMSTDEVLRYKAAQAGASDAAEPLIAKLHQLQRAQEGVTEAARATAAAQKEAAAVAGRRSSFLDGLKQQSEVIGKTRADLAAMQAAQLGVASAAAPYIAKLREAERGHLAFGAGAKLNAFQLQQLGFQMHDFGVQVLSGQSILTAFVQQGSQLSGTFGGAGNAFKAILSTITPMRAALAGAAAAVGVFALALSHAETEARGLNTLMAQLGTSGGSQMFATEELRAFLKELALAPGVTRESATAIVSELSKINGLGGQMLRDIAGISADFAKRTGTDAATAARTLGKAIADPAKGAKDLDEALKGAISSTTLLAIADESLNDKLKAQGLLFGAVKSEVKGLAENSMTPLQKSVNDLGNAWDGAMTKLSQSEGLRTLNALLGQTLGLVTSLVENAPKLGGLGNLGRSMIPGQLPSAVGTAIGDNLRSLIVGAPQKGGATGSWDAPTGAAAAKAAAGVGATNRQLDQEIKKGEEVAKGFRSQASEIAEVTKNREFMNKQLENSIALYGKDSKEGKAQQDRLRAGIAGANEQIAAIKKRGTGGGNEPEQVRAQILSAGLGQIKDALQDERSQFAFSNRLLQAEYQSGTQSLADFYAEKRRLIAAGTDAEIAGLEKQKQLILADIPKVEKKDPSKAIELQKQADAITRDQERLRTQEANEVQLTNKELAQSFKQLDEQVLQYHASLKSLQGDEIGAARIRDEIARKQLAVLADQSKGSKSPITDADQANFAAAQRQVSALNEAKFKTSVINQQLQIQEERIGLAVRTGSIGEIAAMGQLGAARAKAAADLEKQLEEMEKAVKERPLDLQLNLETSRARLELEKLMAELDPLKEKFDNLFKDAGANFFEDLMNGGKLKDAFKNFASAISKEMNSVISKELSQMVFGKGGTLGGAGGMLADLFGGKSFGGSKSFDSTTLPTGDFARMDRKSGEQSIMDLFSGAGEGAAAMAAQTAATSTLTAAYTTGASAFASLTSAAYSATAALNSIQASGGGGGGMGSLFGGTNVSGIGGGNWWSGNSGLNAPGGANFGMDLGFSGSSGGYTGKKDPKKIAGVVHGDEYVFSAPAVRAIGVERLERMHSKAKTGDTDELPGYANGGYVAVLGSSRPMQRGSQWSGGKDAPARAGDTYHVSVTATPGVTREQAMNQGRDIQRGIQVQAGRRARNS